MLELGVRILGLFFALLCLLRFFGHCRWVARHLGSAEANLQTQDYYKSGADEDYQMEPPEPSVMRLQLCAEAWPWLSPRSDLFDVRVLPGLSIVI